MANLSLKSLLGARFDAAPSVTAQISAMEGPLGIEDAAGNLLM